MAKTPTPTGRTGGRTIRKTGGSRQVGKPRPRPKYKKAVVKTIKVHKSRKNVPKTTIIKKRKTRGSRRKYSNFGTPVDSLQNINSINGVYLTDYQEDVMQNFITSDRHGMLLWWEMGTGKTIAGLTFALNYPGTKVNVICPPDLASVWRNDMKKVPGLRNEFVFHDIESFDFNATFFDELVIVDEAHHLVTTMKNSKQIDKIITNLNGSAKILLLTGTPMYGQFTDFVYLTNIAAGEEILPYNATAFKHKYSKKKLIKSFIYGYLAEFCRYLKFCMEYMHYYDKGAQVIKLTAAKYEMNTNIVINSLASFVDGLVNVFAYPSRHINGKIADLLVGMINKYMSGRHSDYVTLNYEEMSTQFLGFNPNPLGPPPKHMPEKQHIDLRNSVCFSFFICAILAMIPVIVLNTLPKKDSYYRMSHNSIANDIKDYVSYYKNIDNEDNMIENVFPTSTRHVKTASYTMQQMNAWMELSQGVLNIDVAKDLSLLNEEDIKYYAEKLTSEQYLENGVYIGNLGHASEGEFSNKFEEILKVAEGTRAVFYSNSYNSGSKLFMEFLDVKQVPYLFLDKQISDKEKTDILEDFKNGTIFLVLHPIYTEGITIHGAQQVHLLEPFKHLAKKEQVIARAIRFGSHLHLPLDERHVDVYQWCCVTGIFTDFFKKIYSSIKNWAKYDNQVFYTSDFVETNRDFTPDSMVLANETTLADNITALSSLLEYQQMDMTCCMDYPNEKQKEECMRNINVGCK